MKGHILVIDDEKEITDLIEIYLNQEGYHVTKRYDAKTLLDDLKEQVDLVILDVMMPEIDGLTALSIIREQYNIPVIIVSAKTSDEDKISGLLAGADDYVSKPFNALELVARVKSQMRRANVFNKPKKDRSHIIEANDLYIFGGGTGEGDKIGEYVEFEGADVLFLYSTMMLNNSTGMSANF